MPINAYVGGICGENNGTINNCFNRGAVSATFANSVVGGVCGNNEASVSNCYNSGLLETEGALAENVCGETDRDVANCYYLASQANDNGGRSAEQFESGEVAYLLNAGQTEPMWGQNLGSETLPIISDNFVYMFGNCMGKTAYTNDFALAGTTGSHDFSEKVLSESADENGLYSYVCKCNHSHLSIVNYDGNNNLVLKYDATESLGFANNLYVDNLELADGDVFNVPVAFTAIELSYTRKANKDTMTVFLPFDVIADDVNGGVYKLTGVEGNNLKYSHLGSGDILKANTPYLVYKNRGSERDNGLVATQYGVTVNQSSARNEVGVTVGDKEFVNFGSFDRSVYTPNDEYDYYAYKDGRFLRARLSMTMSPFRGAIRASKSGLRSYSLSSLGIIFDNNEQTSDPTIDVESESCGKVRVCDSVGRVLRICVDAESALEGLMNGVYIVNGKKVIVK